MLDNIFSLPEYTVTKIKNDDHDYHIYANTTNPPKNCQSCFSDNIVHYGAREQVIRDLPIYGKRVNIYIETLRFKCRSCAKTFYETLPVMANNRHMTARLLAWISNEATGRPFSTIANEVGVDDKTVRNIFKEHINNLAVDLNFELPRYLGIDEIHLHKKFRCVMANIEKRTAFELLPSRDMAPIVNYLLRLKGRQTIELVTMDMSGTFRPAIKRALPQAKIVIDKFHVMKSASKLQDVLRVSVGRDLPYKCKVKLRNMRFILLKRENKLKNMEPLLKDVLTNKYPVLGDAHRVREDFQAIYDNASSRQEAKKQYLKWLDGLNGRMKKLYEPLITSMKNWDVEIFNYFEYRVTNAYTESLNNLVRAMNSLGRGYSFDVLRAKMLCTEGLHTKKVSKPKFQRIPQGSWAYMGPRIFDADQIINYGVDMDKLALWIKEGNF